MLTSPPASPPARTPRVNWHPAYTDTFGPEAVELSAKAGLVLDPWQVDSLSIMLAFGPDGRWVCSDYAEIVGRQNGKSAVLEARMLAGLFLLDEQLIIFTAHQYKTAMELFLRVKALIRKLVEAGEVDAAAIKEINTNGEQGFERLDTGQRIKFIARSKDSGRGFSGDLVIVDEAYAYTVAMNEALMPTMSARPNPQIVYTSSPPLTGDTGEILYGLRTRGEAGGDDSLCWRDWGLPGCLEDLDQPGAVDVDDPANWEAANPAWGIRITIRFTSKERRGMTREGFARERLGIWPRELRAKHSAVISAELWSQLADRSAGRPIDRAFCIDVSPSRTTASILMAGVRADGLVQVAVVDQRPGTRWIPARAKELQERWSPVCWAVDGKSPAAAQQLDLKDVGIVPPDDVEHPHRGHLALLSATDAAVAWAMFVDAVRESNLRHSDDAPLNLALASATTRTLAGGSAWARGADDITALVGATNATWALLTLRDKVLDDSEPSAHWL